MGKDTKTQTQLLESVSNTNVWAKEQGQSISIRPVAQDQIEQVGGYKT